jgi:hypothetical protein
VPGRGTVRRAAPRAGHATAGDGPAGGRRTLTG